MKVNKKTTIFISILTVILLILFYLSFSKINIRIIAFNDFHGNIENAAKFVYAIKKESNRNTIIVSAGDNYNGEVISNIFYGKPISEIFKEINISVSAVGNHEFDWGIDKFDEWSKDMNASFITANIYKDNNKKIFEPYIIKEINGVKIAFIGLTTLETLYKADKEVTKGLKFFDPVEMTALYVKELKKQNVDLIILLAHIGTYQDGKKLYFENNSLSDLVRINGVDAIISGHYHEYVMGYINNIPIVQSLHSGKAFSKIDFSINRFTKTIKNINVSNIILDNSKLKEDKKSAEIISKYKNEVSITLSKVIGKLDKDLKYDRQKLSPLGQFICKILRKETDSQIALFNGGGIRGELYSGDITLDDIYRIMPFNNLVIKYKISGKDIKKLLEIGNGQNAVGALQFSGINIKNNSLFLDNGEEILDNNLYIITANDFMINGGDNYDFSNGIFLMSYGDVRDIIIKYFEKNK